MRIIFYTGCLLVIVGKLAYVYAPVLLGYAAVAMSMIR